MYALQDTLDQAEKKGVAIGRFNVTDLVSLKAVFGAAQEKVPVLGGWSSYCNGSLSESVVGGGIGGRPSLNALRSFSHFSQATFVAPTGSAESSGVPSGPLYRCGCHGGPRLRSMQASALAKIVLERVLDGRRTIIPR
jgi:hypothetical protein